MSRTLDSIEVILLGLPLLFISPPIERTVKDNAESYKLRNFEFCNCITPKEGDIQISER